MHEPELSDEEAAEAVAYLDGRLPHDRRRTVEARAAAEPAFAAALERRARAAGLIAGAVAETEAPLDLRLRIDALPSAPRRRSRRWLPFAASAAAAAAAVIVAVGAGDLSVRGALQAAARPPLAAVSVDPLRPVLLRQRVDGVRFPNLEQRFGWRAIGARADELDDRRMRTVFYERGGKRLAYTIVAGEALDWPDAARRSTLGGVRFETLREGGRVVVTWRRRGRTCVLSGAGVDARTLLGLAAWRGDGALI